MICEHKECNEKGRQYTLEYLPYSQELLHKKLRRVLPDKWARWLANRWPQRWLPVVTVHYFYCAEHAQKGGFCYLCGQFWGGIERFDFEPSGLCPNCLDEVKYELGEYDEPDAWDDYFYFDVGYEHP